MTVTDQAQINELVKGIDEATDFLLTQV